MPASAGNSSGQRSSPGFAGAIGGSQNKNGLTLIEENGNEHNKPIKATSNQ
jgi:hypothetical protein